jgi:hypothetical protein
MTNEAARLENETSSEPETEEMRKWTEIELRFSGSEQEFVEA